MPISNLMAFIYINRYVIYQVLTVILSKSIFSLYDFKIGMHRFGEGNGKPLQYSCLENPMDGGAWWATVMGSLRVGRD